MSVRQLIASSLPASLRGALKGALPSMRIERQLAASLPPLICVDVGASYYPHPAWRLLRQSANTHWLAVEPNESNLDYVRHWQWPCKISTCTTGLSLDGGPKTLYVTNVDSGSSLLEPVIPASLTHRITHLDYFFPVRTHTIETLTLPQALADQPADVPVVIKLDTQGTELQILQGGDSLLVSRRVVGVEMEATLLAQPVMQGAGTFAAAMQYLEGHGFELLFVKPIPGQSRLGKKRTRGRLYLNECDAVFALRQDVARSLSVGHRAALLAFYVCNRMFEEALHVLEQDREVNQSLQSRGCDVQALIGSLRARA